MQHKKLFIVLATLLGMAVSFGAYGQKITVRGTVTDSEGPVIGAVVSSSGANAVTDLDGAFSINVPSDATLEISALGYKTLYDYPYHGKAAAAGATLTQVAQGLGWSADVWDFSGAVPTLK